MKRLIVCGSTNGGICHYTFSLSEALHLSGDEVTVLTLNDPSYELLKLAHTHTVKSVLKVSTRKISRLYNPLLNMHTLMKEARHVDLVHFQWPMGPRTDPMQWKNLKIAGKHIVYTAHNVISHEQGSREESHVAWLYAEADAIIVHGNNLKETLLKRFAVDAKKVHVVVLGNYNFIADRFDKWERTTARSSFGWSEKERVVLFFGMIRHYKGLDTLIAACKILMANDSWNGTRLRLLVAGASVYNHWQEAGYAQQIAMAGLTSNSHCAIEFVPMEDIGRYCLACDVLAIPYRSGSQSAAVQLAYAYAKPVVLTDVGSLAESVQDGITGLVVPPEDPVALAKALHELLSDEGRAVEMGRQGRLYAETHLSWQTIAEQTQQIYKTVACT